MYAKTPAHFPLEIIHEFLKWFILFGHTRWEDLRKKQFTASAVCRAWSEVVLGNSEYWRTISLQLCTKPTYTQFCIANAKSGPITLNVDLARHAYDQQPYTELYRGRCMTLSRFLSSTLPHLRTAYPRVKSIHFTADLDVDIVAALAVLGPYGGTSVHTASFLSWGASGPSRAFTTQLESMPALERMLTRGMRPLAFGVGVYKTLTELTVSFVKRAAGVTQTELATALRACEALEVLQMVDVACSGAFGGPPVVLSHVKRVRVEYVRDECAAALAHLTFPALEELSVQLGYAARIQTLTTTAPSLFRQASHVTVYSANASVAALIEVVLVAREALTLDVRRSTFVDDPFEPEEHPVELEIVLQLTKLESIWLPCNIPLSAFRILADTIACTRPAVGVRLVTEAMMDLGDDDDCEWEFDGLSMVATAVTLREDDGCWMDPCDASGNVW